MGSDALVDIDQSCWIVLAKYNLVLATTFGLLLLWVKLASPANPETILLVENGVFTLVFGGVQTYAWISS